VSASALQSSELTDNAEALEIQGASANLVIASNRIHDNDQFWATDRSYTGINVAFASGPITIRDNEISGNHAPSGAPPDGVGIEVYGSTGLAITSNQLVDNADALETGTDAVADLCGLSFTGNVVYKTTTMPVEAHGLILRCAQDSTVANNTFDGLDRFAIDIIDGTSGAPFGGSIARLSVHDNVFVGGRALSVDTVLPSSVTIDRDVFYNPPGSTAADGSRLAFVVTRSTSSLTDLRAWTGQESTGLWADPYFVDRGARDYRLRAGSAASGKGAFPSPTTIPGPTVPRFDHIFVVVEENHAYEQIVGSPEAPYLDFLAGEGTSATDFYALTHPSLPNYLGLIGGDTFGVATDCSPADPGCSVAGPSLPDRIEDAGMTWRGYYDGMSSPCLTSNSGSYRINHDPFIYFDPIRTNAARCAAGVRPFGDLATDLASRSTTRNLSFIVPDNCHDMHDCSIKAGDDWLRGVLPSIFDSPAWATGNALLVLTFDEDDGAHGNRIYAAFLGPRVRPLVQLTTTADLYDLLRTFEDAWSLPPLTANDAAATALSGAFRTSPAADTTAPSTPTGLSGSSPSPTEIALSWTASVDAVGIARYEVYRDGAWLGTTTSTTFSDTTVTAGTTYTYRVRARDAETNVSDYSPGASVTAQSGPPPPPPSGTVTRGAVATAVNATASSSITIPQPSGVVAGDVLVACIATNGGGVAGAGVPAGWQPIASALGVSNPHVFGYYHLAGSTEPTAWTWGLSTAVTNGGGIVRYSGVDPATPLDTAPVTGSGALASSATLPGVSTATANAMVVGCVGVNSSSLTLIISSPVGMTEAWDIGGKRHELADGAQAVAGPTGARTWTFSSARDWAGWLVALRAL
jgi:acid phosphatase